MTMKDRSFKKWDEQIDKLSADHNINIVSKESAKFALQNYSYYTLVNGYQRALEKEPNTEFFLDGISIEQLGQIQLIESHIASDLLHAIIIIEKKIKTIFQYEISRNIGILQDDYLDFRRYKTRSKKYDRRSVMNNIKEVATVSNKASKSLKKYRKEGNVPPWILINDITFGQLEHWYKILPNDIKECIVSEFHFNFEKKEYELEFFQMSLNFLLDFRNGLAHGDVINKIKPYTKIHWWSWEHFYSPNILAEQEYGKQALGQNDLYALILLLGILLQSTEQIILKNSLSVYLEALDKIFPSSEAPMRRLLGGLPSNFKSRLNYIFAET